MMDNNKLDEEERFPLNPSTLDPSSRKSLRTRLPTEDIIHSSNQSPRNFFKVPLTPSTVEERKPLPRVIRKKNQTLDFVTYFSKVILAAAILLATIIIIVYVTNDGEPLTKPSTTQKKSIKEVEITSSSSISASLSKSSSSSVSPSPSPEISGDFDVSSEQQVCSRIGKKMFVLKNNNVSGNAVDAAIATAFCLAVVHPYNTGIGGDGMLLVTVPSQNNPEILETITLDFRGTAPSGVDVSEYTKNSDAAKIGSKSVLIPGFLNGLRAAHAKWASLEWETLVSPSVNLAKNGFIVSPQLANQLQENSELIFRSPELSKVFTRNSILVQEGQTISWPEMGNSLEKIANDPGSFFESSDFTSDLSDLGISTYFVSDLGKYLPLIRNSVNSSIGGYTIMAPPPPSSGIFTLLGVNVMNTLLSSKNSQSNLTSHQLAETFNFLFGRKNLLCEATNYDEQYNLNNLISDDLISLIANQIKKQDSSIKREVEFYGSLPEISNFVQQSQISVIDQNGISVSLTTSLGSSFGSGLVLSRTGIVLNNQINEFSFEQNAPNFFNFDRRPATFMSPLIVLKEGKVVLAIGSTGGSGIITSEIQVLTNYLLKKFDLKKSINLPRIHSQLSPNQVFLETWVPVEDQKSLIRTAHQLSTMWQDTLPTYPSVGSIQAVEASQNGVKGYNDERSGPQ